MTDRIPLPLLPRELAQLPGVTAPAYRRAYNAALDGRIPAERSERGWTVARADLHRIAELLGCAPVQRAAA